MTEDLVTLYDFLDEANLIDMEVRKNDLDHYIDSMALYGSPVTGMAYSNRTIRRRVSTVRAFYKWAQDKGWSKHRFNTGELRVSKYKHHSTEKIAPDVLEPSSQAEDKDVRAINVDDLVRILDASGSNSIDSIDLSRSIDGPCVLRDTTSLRLKIETCLQAGLRRAEVITLKLSKIQTALEGQRLSPLTRYSVMVLRKGGAWKPVMFPGWLLEALKRYIEKDRAQLIAEARRRDPEFKDHGYLFVRSDKAGPGKRLHSKSLNSSFRKLLMGIGVTRNVAVIRDGTEQLEAKAKYGVHALRHTFAVHTYFSRKAIGDAEPWKYIQAQLGHENDETTRRIYMRIVDEHEAQAGAILSMMLRERVFGHG